MYNEANFMSQSSSKTDGSVLLGDCLLYQEPQETFVVKASRVERCVSRGIAAVKAQLFFWYVVLASFWAALQFNWSHRYHLESPKTL
jgi:hypothetical protein